jgi:hypothetical protein
VQEAWPCCKIFSSFLETTMRCCHFVVRELQDRHRCCLLCMSGCWYIRKLAEALVLRQGFLEVTLYWENETARLLRLYQFHLSI